jgi:hypothetical protein
VHAVGRSLGENRFPKPDLGSDHNRVLVLHRLHILSSTLTLTLTHILLTHILLTHILLTLGASKPPVKS